MLLIAFKIFDDLFATVLTIAWKADSLGAAGLLGQLTPGDDYGRLVPLMEAVPAWLHGMWVLAAALYGVAFVRVVLRKGSPHVFVLAALGLEVAANALGRPIVAATGVVVNPEPSVLASLVFPFVVPVMLAAVLWMTGRTSEPFARPS